MQLWNLTQTAIVQFNVVQEFIVIVKETMKKCDFDDDGGDGGGGRDEILEFRSRLECGFM